MTAWRLARDGDQTGLAIYERHYSARRYGDGRDRRLFVGPGEKLVLLSDDRRGLFVWRKFQDRIRAGDWPRSHATVPRLLATLDAAGEPGPEFQPGGTWHMTTPDPAGLRATPIDRRRVIAADALLARFLDDRDDRDIAAARAELLAALAAPAPLDECPGCRVFHDLGHPDHVPMEKP